MSCGLVGEGLVGSLRLLSPFGIFPDLRERKALMMRLVGA